MAFGVAQPAWAETASSTPHHAESTHHNSIEFGLGATALAAFEDKGTESHSGSHFGVGLSVTVPVIPNWLEVELMGRMINIERGLAYPIDLMLRKPFVISEHVHLYVALGPSMVVYSRRKESAESGAEPVVAESGRESGVYFGVASAVGVDLWLTPRYGVFIEPNFNMYWHEGATIKEVGGVAGAMVGF